eukprot:TRINITY_DN433_c0_g1_i1.p1 TRINITY_DN433_c0_g1~~TRINITY_DN433_c0_g1_i1.p1  ORF type:complete len:348 (-),score=123.63 TRINITY_DN433_c0_g1_i1:249-1292(-)
MAATKLDIAKDIAQSLFDGASQVFEESLSKTLSASRPSSPRLQQSNGHDFHDVDIDHVDVDAYGIHTKKIFRNAAVPILYEQALARETGSALTNSGALVTKSGAKTGRSPKDKRIVDEASSTNEVWWGPVNVKLSDESFLINRERAVDYLNTRDQLFVVDGYAGWDPKYRIKVRIVCERAYHALFMQNMLIRPTREQLANFGEPDYVIYNAGMFPANRFTKGMTSSTSVSLHLGRKEMVILGTQYAGEMKKGVLTIMMYLMPKMGALPLHSSADEMVHNLFFGQLRNGREDSEGVASQQDDVLRVTSNGGDLCVGDELERVRATCVLCDIDVVVIDHTIVLVVHDVL